jgi:hypothetical protein
MKQFNLKKQEEKKKKKNMKEDLETCASIEFHGISYVVTINVQQQQQQQDEGEDMEPHLYIQVEVDEQQPEQEQSTNKDMPFTCWTGLFSANCKLKMNVCKYIK